MKATALPMTPAFKVELAPFSDARGRFTRLFCRRELAQFSEGLEIVQINHSLTHARGVIRGLHFQMPPKAEAKIVCCLRGRVFDVMVDLRLDSPTFLRWHAEELHPEGVSMVCVPKGFAHGFQILEPDSELLYFHSEYYSPDAEGGLRYNDPRLGIPWPLAVAEVSARDSAHALLHDGFQGIPL
jgi:dTDP-4-dehydrorhamnose 3,5-epimerase